jgi:hypothetical protein
LPFWEDLVEPGLEEAEDGRTVGKMSRWQNAVAAGVGYWILSGAFNAMTDELRGNLAKWAAVGTVFTAVSALTDVSRRAARNGSARKR